MKRLFLLIPLVFLLCFTFGFKKQTGQLHPEIKKHIESISAFMSENGFNDLENLNVNKARSILDSIKIPEEVLPSI